MANSMTGGGFQPGIVEIGTGGSNIPTYEIKEIPEKLPIDDEETFTNRNIYPATEAVDRLVRQGGVVNEEYLSQFWERCKDIPLQNAYDNLDTTSKQLIGAINELLARIVVLENKNK